MDAGHLETVHLPTLAEELLAQARVATSGRAAVSIRSGRELRLRETVIALVAGSGMDDHETNGEATLQVLEGRARVRWMGESLEVGAGEAVGLPAMRHALDALTDAVVLLTVAVR